MLPILNLDKSMKMFIYIVLGVVTLVSFVFLFFNYKMANPQDNYKLETEIDNKVAKFLPPDNQFALMLGVYKGGETFTKSYGSSNEEFDKNSLFQIGSISKIFTASLLDALVKEGRLSYKTTLDDVLSSSIILSDLAKTITLKQLATHRAGLPRLPKSFMSKLEDLVGKENMMQNPYSHFNLEDIYEYLKTTTEQSAVGKFNYSNYGMGLLGHILERETGSSLDELAHKYIFTPQNMQNSGIETPDNQAANFIQGHDIDGNKIPRWEFSILAGAGAFYSNMIDMMKFSKNSIDNQMSIGWLSPSFIDNQLRNSSIVWHNGSVSGYSSYISVDRDNKTAVVFLSNQPVSLDMIGSMTTRLVRTQSWSKNTMND